MSEYTNHPVQDNESLAAELHREVTTKKKRKEQLTSQVTALWDEIHEKHLGLNFISIFVETWAK